MPSAAVTSGAGRVGETTPSEDRPEGMRNRATAYNRGRLDHCRVTSLAETVQGIREYFKLVDFPRRME